MKLGCHHVGRNCLDPDRSGFTTALGSTATILDPDAENRGAVCSQPRCFSRAGIDKWLKPDPAFPNGYDEVSSLASACRYAIIKLFS
jgi:hypothetical protein